MRFAIEDDLHADLIGRYEDREAALVALRRIAALAWDAEPNRAPCEDWRTCGRNYDVVEYDTAQQPGREVARTPTLKVSAEGVIWLGAENPA